MTDISFASPSGVDWAEAVEVINANTNQPLTDLVDALIELRVNDDCNSPVLTGSTTDGKVTVIPAEGLIQWRFTKEQMSGFCRGNTYAVGCRITPSGGGTSMLFTGSLAYLDGEF